MPDINKPQLNIPSDATSEQKAKAYSNYFGIPFVDLKNISIPQETFSAIPYDVSKTFGIIAYEFDKFKKPQILKVAVGDPSRLQRKAPAILSELKKQKGITIELAVTPSESFDYALNLYKKLIGKKQPINEQKPMSEIKKKPSSGDTYPMIDLREVPITYQVLNKFPEDIAIKYQIAVFEAEGDNKIKIAAVNPRDPKVQGVINFVRERNKIDIEVYETSAPSMEWALRRYHVSPKVATAMPVRPIPTTVKEETVKNVPEASKPVITEIKKEPPKFEEKTEAMPQKFSSASVAPEIKAEEITASGLRQPENDNESRVTIQSVSEEAEKNLDKILPRGVSNVDELEVAVKSGFIPKTLAAILYFAVIENASDIHIEIDRGVVRLRYRIDGLLRDILKMPFELLAPIVSRIKIMAKLKIDETRIPQDGRFDVKIKDREIDVRVSTLPTIYGEKAVLRILDKSSQHFRLEDLGLMGNALKVLDRNIAKPYGVVLATGPTGSGKTTTLYCIISKINKPEVNVVTLEDPVEYEIPDVNQCQIKPKIGFGFAEGLRSILRQDPNIIMVGEIRDQETASMVTHAALTGHLVLSTLHTNDTASALPRLINMGVEPFLITSAINCILAQRLVRKICPKCIEEYKIPDATVEQIKKEINASQNSELAEYKNKELKFYHGKGCSNCTDGYKGRLGLFEILELSEKIENLAVSHSPANMIKDEAIKEGMLTMKEDGIIKVLKGLTTIDELLRVTTE
jgi:type II secretory ATPase GspE/PulE/Tfp pilus assembly ATPase PilB-like protein